MSFGAGEAPTIEALPEGVEAKKRRTNWVGWGLALVIIASCFLFVDPDDLLASLKGLTILEIIVLLLLSTADRSLRGCNWAFLLRIVDVRTPLWRVVRYFYQGSFSGAFLPVHIGGDLLRAWWVSRDSGITHPVYASLAAERLLGLVAAVNWGILGGVILACELHPGGTVLYAVLGVLAALGVNPLLMSMMSPRLHALVLGLLGASAERNRVWRFMHKLYEAFARFSHDLRRLLLNALLAFIVNGLQVSIFVAIAWFIGATTDLVAFFAAACLHTLVYKLPIAPDGWGVGELTAIGVYGLIGVSPAQAFAIGVVGHVIPILALSPGFLFLLFGQQPGPPVPAQRADAA